MKRLFINGEIFAENGWMHGWLLSDGERIAGFGPGEAPEEVRRDAGETVDLEGKWLLPGVIDDQVHFRDPGLTRKGDMATESRAAVAGGVTSFMDMPNTVPQTVTIEAWEAKMERAAAVSHANYAFFFGATNDNGAELDRLDACSVPGLKVFLGASTGNMLVDSQQALDDIFSRGLLVAVHSEDEEIIRRNAEGFRSRYGDNVPVSAHPLIRSHEACVASTRRAMERACRLGTRLHVLHISTAEEARMLSASLPLEERKITGEACVHHLWFTSLDYERLGARVKWNPAVKDEADRAELRRAVADGRISVVATDHAPHLLSEKEGGALKAASGGPSVQYSLLIMLELALQGHFPVEKVVETMCHNPATLFRIRERGFIRRGYYADLTVVDPHRPTLAGEKIWSRCGWTPYEGVQFSHSVDSTYVNGSLAYCRGEFPERNPKPLVFNN